MNETVRRRGSRVARLGAALWVAALCIPAGLAAGERVVESVGAVALDRNAPSRAPRQEALASAVHNAVLSVARGLLPDDFAPPEGALDPEPGDADPSAWLASRLGDDLLVYATQYSILEDRGERPAMFSRDAGVEFEYVVLARVGVDAGAVADHLASLGLLGPGGPRTDVVLILEGLDSYQPLAMLQRALEADRGVRAVVPVEFSRGRAVLSLAADRSAREVVADLERNAPPELQWIPVELGAREATLLVHWRPVGGPR